MRKAMILAAGRGTRLRPMTDHMPKALVEVGGKTLVGRQMDALKKSGFNDITVNVFHFADMLCDYLSRNTPAGISLHVSSERERLLDTGGALKKARTSLLADGYCRPVIVHNVDILSNADLAGFFRVSGKYDAALLVSERDSSRRLYFDRESMRLVGWGNLATGETRSPFRGFAPQKCRALAFSGIHAISPKALEAMDGWPEEFSVIDFYLKECAALDIRGIEAANLKLVDVGKLDTLRSADAFAEMLGREAG